jgi:phenylpyruvate tautomerase PptA (4-oxalocrotonate tautomerase family)
MSAPDFDLDAEQTAALMQDLGEVLIEHLGFLPDITVILRRGKTARTLFAGGMATNQHPNESLRDMLTQALRMHDGRHPGEARQ